jgi:hypothetical protein
MKYTEIREKKQRLKEIMEMKDSREFEVSTTGEKYDTGQYERFMALRQLALKLGGSPISTARQKTANEGELVYSIHNALQTETMIYMCKTAARNFWITIIVATAAVFSALAAWAAIIKIVR